MRCSKSKYFSAGEKMFEEAGVERTRTLPCRGTSLMRNTPSLGPYSGLMPRALWWPKRGVVSYERGTPVG